MRLATLYCEPNPSSSVRWARQAALAILLALCGRLPHAYPVTISTVPIGNPGNPADTRFDWHFVGGSVAHSFRMGRTEVTNAQYVEFLNAVAVDDRYNLYDTEMADTPWGGIVRTGSFRNYRYAVKPPAIGWEPDFSDYVYDNKPVVWVSWLDAVRFANWLHNGQGGAGTTEYGAYTLNGIVDYPSPFDPPSNSVRRNPGAKWFLPSEDEWYKAAYYDPQAGVYHVYPTGPTGPDLVPDNNWPLFDTGNSSNHSAEYYSATGSFYFPLTDAGAHTLSGSAYGTFDQGGNVREWNETLIGTFDGALRGFRGGGWQDVFFDNHAYSRGADPATMQFNDFGFRVASAVPESNSTCLLGMASLGMLVLRKQLTAPRPLGQ